MSSDEITAEGYGVDSRVHCHVRSGKFTFYKSELDKDEFLSLIWHEIDASRLLTPPRQPRTILDVAKRVIQNHTFQSLSRNQRLSRNQHDPGWFSTCCEIESCFDYGRFGAMGLVLANEGERNQSPSGTYYIYDGNHKSLVLGKLLLEDKIKYIPVKAFLIHPRPSD